MKVLIALSALLTITTCGLIHHDHDDHKATSYQNIHIEHYHSVPTYVKKEHAHLLEHPISKGQTSSKVEVHHGGKHDHGYAIADSETNLHHEHEGHDFSAPQVDYHGYEGHHLSAGDESHGHLTSGNGEGQGYESHGHLSSGNEHGGEGHGYESHGHEGHSYAVAEEGHAYEASLGQGDYAHQEESAGHESAPQYHGYAGGDESGLGHYQ